MTAGAVHANCAIVGTIGLLIRGDAGSGKTSLCDLLIEVALSRGNFGRLVSDDYVHLSVQGARLIAEAPETIRGRMEVRGFGLVEQAFERRAQVHLVIDLQPLQELERLPESCLDHVVLEGIQLPVLKCPADQPFNSMRMIRWALRKLLPGNLDYI
ncbi:HPr kinase/phosphatase C-terminal domain-containing protein [uncultured Roseibium sp.]|uniref:HPr kinase/phosphorylase n=1 Tax=uncultured Roseibium sp. TaxID=1936171 RepID=UPI002620AC02|nr:HPr kinase/phosphatase C-terminal domain-containing protein [uncultured Roseibium sp.]